MTAWLCSGYCDDRERARPRPIPQFTRYAELRSVRECSECMERITWGLAVRRVYGIGRALEVRFAHENCA